MSQFTKDELALIHEALLHQFDKHARVGTIHIPLGDLIGKVADLRESMGDTLAYYEEVPLADLAEASGLSHDQLRRAAYDGRLEARRAATIWLSSMAAVEEALEDGRLQRRPGRPSTRS